jgi:hypothetical protein
MKNVDLVYIVTDQNRVMVIDLDHVNEFYTIPFLMESVTSHVITIFLKCKELIFQFFIFGRDAESPYSFGIN